MLLNNYKSLIKMYFLTDHNKNLSNVYLPIKRASDGDDWYASELAAGTAFLVLNFNGRTNYSGNGMVIGSGTTTPTENDYQLEQLITTVTFTTPVVTPTQNNNKVGLSALVGVQNTSDQTITISEVGLIRGLVCRKNPAASSDQFQSTYCLVERSLLEEPIILPASEMATIHYDIEYDFPW